MGLGGEDAAGLFAKHGAIQYMFFASRNVRMLPHYAQVVKATGGLAYPACDLAFGQTVIGDEAS